ncbi:MAG: LysM peptidoglycan-binding domain-containing protein [Bacteroidota bacterium]|nr:LysM peptidoglycan-binding domain-containing protein [Bacteroidota bacterium]MDP4191636.1 LysM peptidoglycan-binding domain-containing protein [Bacteroidota bacterium]MDP4196756.1 LysM peptidoglycan-binding domain-containing protein [Bacteroidota bacterium]
MKIARNLAGVFALLLFLSVSAFAQEKMTKEEWQNEMNTLNEQKQSLTRERDSLQAAVNTLKTTNVQNYDDCINELYASLGVTRGDVDNFRRMVSELNGRIMRKESPKTQRQAELDSLKRMKISALPEFFDKVHNQMQRSLDAWNDIPAEKNYTVVRGDCLWNIAKKKDVYNNAFAWPKIYQANRDQIKNPDLIFPKQIFKIPNLTEDEKAQYNKMRRNYKPAPPRQTTKDNTTK